MKRVNSIRKILFNEPKDLRKLETRFPIFSEPSLPTFPTEPSGKLCDSVDKLNITATNLSFPHHMSEFERISEACIRYLAKYYGNSIDDIRRLFYGPICVPKKNYENNLPNTK